ncbi:MAG: peroxiredoxin family protein [Planctomycetota bacterium]|nr:peroxiredoxin family protein [Planctomycetota bacterium]
MNVSKRSLRQGVFALTAVAATIAWANAHASADEQSLKVGDTAPDFELVSHAGETVTLSDLVEDGRVVLVVLRGYPGYQCPLCNKQVSDFLQQAKKFKQHGVQVAFVYPGTSTGLSDRAQEFLGEKKLPEGFHLLIDADYEFTNEYGLRWDAVRETAYPSTFVIEKDQTISFVKISNSHAGRTSTKEILKELADNN